MTTGQLHIYLDDPLCILAPHDLKKIIAELKSDCFNQLSLYEVDHRNYHFYNGEVNAFQICLDLLDHLADSFVDFKE